jgi:phosphoribosylformylglycinamidine cyclo-ligase
MSQLDYKSAGVDVEAGEALVNDIKEAVQNTFSPEVLSPLGGFAGLYDLKTIINDYDEPVLVQSIDGVGTKSIVASKMNDFRGLGQDIVSAAVNDILVCGAKPMTFLDYVASDTLRQAALATLIKSIAKECKKYNISLLGGETAEMPDTYLKGEHDLVGIVTGVVEKKNIIDGSRVNIGDKVIGLISSGCHTNGYSLARKIFFEHKGLGPDTFLPELDETVGRALLAPHRNYTPYVHALLDAGIDIHAMAHISGGGIQGNLNRVLPDAANAIIETDKFPSLPIFKTMQTLGDIQKEDMFRAFNMGIGYVFVVREEDIKDIETILSPLNETVYRIGEILPGQKEVKLI